MTKLAATCLAVLLLLFLGALIRMLRTPVREAEHSERADMAALLFLVLLGSGGAIARDRFAVNSARYWMANAVLIPICLLAIWYISRLVQTYRGAPPQRRYTRSTARVLRPPKLDPPSDPPTGNDAGGNSHR